MPKPRRSGLTPYAVLYRFSANVTSSPILHICQPVLSDLSLFRSHASCRQTGPRGMDDVDRFRKLLISSGAHTVTSRDVELSTANLSPATQPNSISPSIKASLFYCTWPVYSPALCTASTVIYAIDTTYTFRTLEARVTFGLRSDDTNGTMTTVNIRT